MTPNRPLAILLDGAVCSNPHLRGALNAHGIFTSLAAVRFATNSVHGDRECVSCASGLSAPKDIPAVVKRRRISSIGSTSSMETGPDGREQAREDCQQGMRTIGQNRPRRTLCSPQLYPPCPPLDSDKSVEDSESPAGCTACNSPPRRNLKISRIIELARPSTGTAFPKANACRVKACSLRSPRVTHTLGFACTCR
mgnify:CR=1 FL=1